MMFDPPDFPYKDLNETMKEQFGSNTALFNTPTEALQTGDEEFDKNESSELLLLEKSVALPENNAHTFNTELFIIQADTIFTNGPALLDENTVNQFLLPTEPNPKTDTNEQPKGPDLLALHSCTICHEIFMNDNDMVEHSIINHSDEKVLRESFNNFIGREDLSNLQTTELIVYSNGTDVENPKQVGADLWLVCGVCQRILSTASETEPIDQLCCRDENGETRSLIQALATMYLCEVCNALYADSDALELHRIGCINQQNKENISMEDSISQVSNPKEINFCFSCDVCGMQNESIEQLKSHSLVCSPATIPKERRLKNNAGSNKMWNCGSCNQLFATARDLYRHKRGEDRPEGAPLTAFVCDACDKVLGSMCALHTHKKMHRVTKPGFACRVCGRRFNQSGHLAIHMRMHTGERPYPCDLCPKAFKVKVERDDHRRTHTGERPFSCVACPKTFTAAARLREHARIHTDQRPYRCDICGAAFRRPYARTVHTLIHTGAKPHECDVCGTAFRRSGDMWKHKRNLHGDE